MCSGDALVTDIHDAFRPSMQSAGGSHQVQLEWREEEAGKAASARQNETADDAAIAGSGRLSCALLYTIDSSLNVPLET